MVMIALLAFVAAPTFSESEAKLNEEEVLLERMRDTHRTDQQTLVQMMGRALEADVEMEKRKMEKVRRKVKKMRQDFI